MVALLVYVLAPLACAGYLAFALGCGGARRLWRDGLLLALAAALFSQWQRTLVTVYREPGAASGVETWPLFPVAVLVGTLAIQLLAHPRVPTAVRLISGALLVAVVLVFGSWEA